MNIEDLINSAFKKDERTMLRRMFENKLEELNITFNQAEDNLEINYRTINGILDGTLDRIDFLSLLKIAHFLNIQYSEITNLYADTIKSRHKEDLLKSEKRAFILNNFDLPVLKNLGVISSIRDFNHIEQNINQILDLRNILEYNDDEYEVVFSSGSKVPKDARTRKYFIQKARSIFRIIDNPNNYNKEALIEYIPKIRWHSVDKENGLIDVIKSLYKIGITVIFQPRTPSLQIRGATFIVNDRPCIVLTDYRGYYPTLWFALMHEIFHIVFDWAEIKSKKYHLSDEGDDVTVVRQKEDEANEFAREYMFPKAKMEIIRNKISDRLSVREFAMDNQVHPSVIYANFAYDNSNEDDNLWKKFNTLKLFPPLNNLINKLNNGLGHTSKAIEYAAYYKLNIFNS